MTKITTSTNLRIRIPKIDVYKLNCAQNIEIQKRVYKFDAKYIF